MGQTTRTWQIFLVNFLFWSGISQAGVVFAAVYRIAHASWGESYRRIGEIMFAFLPVSFVLFFLMLIGASAVFPWTHEVVPGKELWLSLPFLLARDAVAQLWLMLVSGAYVSYTLRPELGLLAERTAQRESAGFRFRDFFTRDWRGIEAERARCHRILSRLAPVLLISYGLLYTLLAFDLIMSVEPHFYSSLFGWRYFVNTFFSGIAAIVALSVVARHYLGLKDHITREQSHDLGKLLFAFAVFSGGLYFTEYLTIWYGNLPEEIGYVIKRLHTQPWAYLGWTSVVLAYLGPLVILLSRQIKKNLSAMFGVACVILVALWLERFVAVVPSVWTEPSIPFGLIEVALTLGFPAMALLAWLSFARGLPLVPLLPLQDPVPEHEEPRENQ